MNQEAFQILRTKMRGTLILPDESGYHENRSIWNAMIDRRPRAIARCVGVADILACIQFAQEQSLPISIKGGGHNIAGLAVCDGGFMIDLSLMRGVFVDPQKEIANAQPGCVLGDVDRETQLHDLATVLGFVSNTGIAGLTLGGGFGYLTRKYGWTSDNVLSMQMATADGRLVRASESENVDLFWALCGGGGNFGVVTNFEYKLYNLGPEILAGAIAWPLDKARELLEIVRSLANDGPLELSCAVALRIAPPAPWLAPSIHGKPIIAVFVCHCGSVEKAQKDAAPILSFGSPVGNVVQGRPYITQQSIIDATQPKGRRYYWKSEYLATLETEALEKMIEHAHKIVSPHSAVVLFPIGGRLNDLPENHSAVGNRDARFVINITGSWENANEDSANIEWTRAAWRDMRRFSTGGTYINFLTEEEGQERIHAAYRNNYERLTAVKAKWDPQNLFRMNKNILPA